MWSTSIDRERAAEQARTLTVKEQRERAMRWSAFSKGFDTATLLFADRVGIPADITSVRYEETKRTAFDHVDLDERVAARKVG